MNRILNPTIGVFAMLTTVGVIGGHIVLCQHSEYRAEVQTTATASIILESIILVLSAWLASTYALDKVKSLVQPHTSKAVLVGTIASVAASTASIVTIAMLAKAAQVSSSSRHNFIIAQSLLLGIAGVLQLAFLFTHFLATRSISCGNTQNFFHPERGAWSPASYIKSIRYSQTLPRMSESTSITTIRLQESPPSMRTKLMSPAAIKTTMSHAIRPISSRTRLLPDQDRPRPVSLDSHMYSANMNESFDSWDTSMVDACNRRAVMDIAVSPTISKFRNLETIPASPQPSRSPSPGKPLDFPPPPRVPRRAKSFGPQVAPRREYFDIPPSPSELHIHPLFRSDSPNPPPVATPGSNILAAPEAGQVLPHRPNGRPQQRVRSGSLPASPSLISPSDSFQSNTPIPSPAIVEPTPTKPTPERKMTPPVPEHLLTDGAALALPKSAKNSPVLEQRSSFDNVTST